MGKYLVTGGSGFIGTHVVEALITGGHSVLSLDPAKPKVENHIPHWKGIDIRDGQGLITAILGFQPEFVIHLAARTDLNGQTLNDYDANSFGVSNLLDALATLTSLQKVIFASSMYVCAPGYAPSDFDDYAPHTVYGESKVLTEKLIKERNPEYTWCIIRPTSIWGPYFGEPYNLFFKIVLSGKYFHLGSRACKKTYGYIGNTVNQILAIINAAPVLVNKKTFYLGDYEPYNISEWADEIALLSNRKIPTVPFIAFQGAALLGDVMKFAGIKFPMTSFRLKNMTTDNVHDLNPIKSLLPVLPIKRKDGTKQTIEWLRR